VSFKKVLFLLILLSSTANSNAALITTNDILVIEFEFQAPIPLTITPDVLQLIVVGQVTNYTGASATLYDSQQILGQYILDDSLQAALSSPQSGISFGSNVFWGNSGNLMTALNPTVIDFQSITDQTIVGRIEFAPLTGTIDFDFTFSNPNAFGLNLIESTGATGGMFADIESTITNIELKQNTVDAPATIPLIGIALAALGYSLRRNLSW
jgi:hypothetical protein